MTTHPSHSLLGTTLHGFRFDQYLGEGRLSILYKGEQLALRRAVALKVLRPEFRTDSDRIVAFIEAGRKGSTLLHPYIVPIYDILSEGGVHCIVRELVEGESLAGVLARGSPLPLEKTIRIGQEILAALSYAQEMGLSHGNLTPGNVFLGKDDKTRLSDFLYPSFREMGKDAPTGAPPALVFYAPELFDGATPDPRSDLFSLGGLLFFASSGRLPWEPSVYWASLREKKGLPPLSTPPTFDAYLPPSFFQILRDLLEAVPERRPPCLQEVEERLKRLGGEVAKPAPVDISRYIAQQLLQMSPPQQRRYKRFPLDVQVTVSRQVPTKEQANLILSKLKDISENGAYVVMDPPFPVGTLLTVEFDLAQKGARLKAVGLVRWTQTDKPPVGMGVQFLEVSTLDKNQLKQFVEERMGEEMIRTVTGTPSHRAILKILLLHLDQVLPLSQLARSTGSSQSLLLRTLNDFHRYGLIRIDGDGVRCIPPPPEVIETLHNALRAG